MNEEARAPHNLLRHCEENPAFGGGDEAIPMPFSARPRRLPRFALRQEVQGSARNDRWCFCVCFPMAFLTSVRSTAGEEHPP